MQCDAIPYLFRYCDMIECVPDQDFKESGRSTEFVECSGNKPAFAINRSVWQRQRVNKVFINNALCSKIDELFLSSIFLFLTIFTQKGFCICLPARHVLSPRHLSVHQVAQLRSSTSKNVGIISILTLLL